MVDRQRLYCSGGPSGSVNVPVGAAWAKWPRELQPSRETTGRTASLRLAMLEKKVRMSRGGAGLGATGAAGGLPGGRDGTRAGTAMSGGALGRGMCGSRRMLGKNDASVICIRAGRCPSTPAGVLAR